MYWDVKADIGGVVLNLTRDYKIQFNYLRK